MAFSRQHHPWSSAPHSCFASDQFSVWLPLDCQQPRGSSSATAWAREPGGPSNNEFFGNLSFFRRSRLGGACHSSSQLTHAVGCTPVFLGTVRVCIGGGGRLWPAAFNSFLEHSPCGYGIFPGCAFSMNIRPLGLSRLSRRFPICSILVRSLEPCSQPAIGEMTGKKNRLERSTECT